MKIKFYFLTIALLIAHSAIYSQTHTWTGNDGDNNWFNENNWDLGTVPSTNSDVLIPSGFTVEISEETAAASSIEMSGISSLNIENDLNLSGQMTIPPGSNINWLKGIIDGGGTIVNNGLIQMESFGDKELINSTIENNGAIVITNSNFIRFSGGTVINNNENASIEILTAAGIIQDDDGNTINNYGTIRKPGDGSGSLGSSYMIFDLNNAGNIHIGETQQFLFLGEDITFNNLETGIMEGFGAYDITSNYTNTGTINPGDNLSCGTLSVFNNFYLLPQTILVFDITGTNPGEYDMIDVAGFPHLEGNIVLNLEFAPELGDQFQIITANEIMSCNFPETISTQFQGFNFTFEVICDDTNVVLKVVDIILGIEDVSSKAITFTVHPNPATDILTISAADLSISKISIFNSLGQTMLINPGTTIDVSAFPKGLYVVEIETEKEVFRARVLVQ